MSDKKRFRKLLNIFLGSVLAVVVVATITRAIGADVESSYPGIAKDKPVAELIAFNIGPDVETADIPCESIRDMVARGIDVELVGTVILDNETFQMWIYENPQTQVPEEMVSKVMVSGLCGLAYTPYDNAITERVPLEVARSLTLQYYRAVIEAQGGRDQYIANLTASFSALSEPPESTFQREGWENPEAPATIELTSVHMWALEQLDIALPEGSFTVVNIDDAWEYE